MTHKSVAFFIEGHPKPQGSKKHVGRGILIESSKDLPKWRRTITTACAGKVPEPITGPVHLTLRFAMPRPKAWGRHRDDPMVQRPDADKLARALLDGITGPLIVDDSQVVHLEVTKQRAQHGQPTGVWVQARWKDES